MYMQIKMDTFGKLETQICVTKKVPDSGAASSLTERSIISQTLYKFHNSWFDKSSGREKADTIQIQVADAF